MIEEYIVLTIHFYQKTAVVSPVIMEQSSSMFFKLAVVTPIIMEQPSYSNLTEVCGVRPMCN